MPPVALEVLAVLPMSAPQLSRVEAAETVGPQVPKTGEAHQTPTVVAAVAVRQQAPLALEEVAAPEEMAERSPARPPALPLANVHKPRLQRRRVGDRRQ